MAQFPRAHTQTVTFHGEPFDGKTEFPGFTDEQSIVIARVWYASDEAKEDDDMSKADSVSPLEAKTARLECEARSLEALAWAYDGVDNEEKRRLLTLASEKWDEAALSWGQAPSSLPCAATKALGAE